MLMSLIKLELLFLFGISLTVELIFTEKSSLVYLLQSNP